MKMMMMMMMMMMYRLYYVLIRKKKHDHDRKNNTTIIHVRIMRTVNSNNKIIYSNQDQESGSGGCLCTVNCT
jgi:hypothetical protein